MTTILVFFECQPADFGTIMGAIGPNMACVSNLRVETQENNKALLISPSPEENMPYVLQPELLLDVPAAHHPNYRYKKSRVLNVLLSVLNTKKKVPLDTMKAELVRVGLSPNSASPALCHMSRGNIVVKNKDKTWSLVKEPVE